MTTWITLPETKAQLNKLQNVTADDTELAGFMSAACGIVEDLKGHVTPTPFTETLQALRDRTRRPSGCYVDHWFLDLAHTPVLSIVALSRGGVPVTTLPAPQDSTVGVTGPGEYVVGYVAGRAEVPAHYRMAALELVTHLWRSSQLNGSSGRPGVKGDQMMVVPGSASALPYRVRELLGIYGPVTSEHPVIA